VDDPKQNTRHVTPLATLGNYIATLLNRRGLLKRLQEQNEELSSVLRSIPGGVFKYSAQTYQFDYVSGRFMELLGYTRAEFTEKFHNSFLEMIWHEDRQKTLDRIEKEISKTGEYDSCIYRVETHSGKLKWLYDVGHLLTDAAGRQWYEVLVLDYDEQENLRAQLRQTQKRTEAILRWTPGGIICYRWDNEKLHMEYASDGVWRMLGYELGSLKKAPTCCQPIVHPEDVAALHAAEMNMIRTGQPMQMEYRLQKKDGSYLWVHIAGVYEPDGSGSGMLYGTYTDITELVATQQKLTEANAQMETILNALPGGVAVFRIDGTRAIRTFISRGAAQVLGYTPDDPVLEDMSQTFKRLHPDDCQKLSTLISAGLSGSQIRNVELRILPKDKPMRWIRLDANPVRNESGELYYYGIYSDITENVKIRQEQERKQERLLSRCRHELDYVENAGDDRLVAKVRLNLNKAEIEESWVRQDFTPSYTGDTPHMALNKVLATCVRNEQRNQLEKMMRIANLLAEYQADNKDFQVDYQRYAASGRTVWVSTVIHTRMDPVVGQIKAFIYTYDVDEQKAPAMLVERMLATRADFLGLIDVKTGSLHCYHYAGNDPWVAERTDIPYEREIRLFAEKHIDPKFQKRAMQALSLGAVLENITTLDTSYTQSFWMDDDTGRRRMSWRFLWMDESRTTVILAREDVTATYAEQRTQRKKLHQALTQAKQAAVDGLTGLLTRAATEQAIAEKLEEAGREPLALMLMDLDNLKQINDTYGHMEGDEALRSMAAVLKKSFRGSDVIGRVGGDEFMVLLTHLPPQNALHRMTERFMDYMKEQKIGPARNRQLSCSVGVTVGKAETHSFQRLYHEADVALYHVKQRGKEGYAFFDETMAEGHYAGLD
jgi:diguanylate cyclase (GGDEF)-like protein/PAS domain S-box-containing protein